MRWMWQDWMAPKLDTAPDGWMRIPGDIPPPYGYDWYGNGDEKILVKWR